VGLTVAVAIRHDFRFGSAELSGLLAVVPVALVTQLIVGALAGLYRGRWRFGSFDEVAALVRVAAVTTAVAWLASRWPVVLLPRSIAPAGGMIALVGMGATRYVWRLAHERRQRPGGGACTPLLVFGAGEGGAQVLASMLRDPGSPYLPVGLLDDDPFKRQLRILRVPVLGTRADLADVASRTGARSLLVAVPSAGAELIRDLTERSLAAGLEIKVLPTTRELIDGTVEVNDMRTPTHADLMGRREIDTDIAAVAGYLTGRRVLVTGAGGSIGSELCRQIDRLGPAELVLLDRDESALHAVQLSLEGRALLDRPNLVVADIRDRSRVHEVLARWRPEVIFHAAALKHLPLLELHPAEAVKTNVYGTLNLLEAAEALGVERFVNISTDKAADPGSVLGYTKRLAERLTAHTAPAAGTFISVRFGNVLGSRGSMLATFQAQVAAGGPVTVTHPEVTRYFMTVEEAVQLVVQAGAVGRAGEVLVLDMGEPVRIREVAEQMVANCDRPVDIVFTGLRPGEKLHEVLLGVAEEDRRPVHPLISQVPVPPLDPRELMGLDLEGSAAMLVRQLAAAAAATARAGRPVVRR
jgi:FlaA1/EpsC-like NDP-sugar epimerase